MKLDLGDLSTRLRYLPRTLRLIATAAPTWTTAWLVLLTVQGLMPAVMIYLIARLTDSMVAAIGAGVGFENIQETLILAALMAAAMLFARGVQSALSWVGSAQSELMGDHLSELIHAKSTAVDLDFYESPEDRDRLFRARSELRSRPLQVLQDLGGLAQGLVTFVAMGAILLSYGLWLLLVLLVGALPGFYVTVRFNEIHHEWWEKRTVDRRLAQYYDMMLTMASAAAELRLFNLGPGFRASYQEVRKQLREERLGLVRAQIIAGLGATFFALVVTAGAMAWMVRGAFLGLLSLGDLVLFYQAAKRGQDTLGGLLGGLGRIYGHTLYLENLFEFLGLEARVVDPPKPLPAPERIREGVCFRGVDFRYPGSPHLLLEGFDLTLPAGKIVALVGENGAGKTTLVKLLCRFYDPEAGSITVDGSDLRDFTVEEARGLTTTLFQTSQRYHVTASENIAMGARGPRPSDAEIEAAARSAAAHGFISRLDRGYDSLLGRWFEGGVELSGGEWQRLALARAFVRNAPMVVLDEPTSHLDSWSESDWFARFRKLAEGRTALLITHRLTIARQADVIHVMEKGRITESGDHDALVALGGRYADSWNAQLEADRIT